MSTPRVYEVVIDKLVHGGQGLGVLPEGKKALVWNTLPAEKVRFTSQKKKSSYIEGVADEIVAASPEREEPRDELYLSTSPWQMMKYEAENRYKKEILIETLAREKVEYSGGIDFWAPTEPWHYRNKMEYSFYGDDSGLHLALFNRGSHGKRIVAGSSIARPEIDKAANEICAILNGKGVRAGDLKTLVIRCDRKGRCAAALFVKKEDFKELAELKEISAGIVAYFSNPKSPASVATKKLYQFGDTILQDKILGQPVKYDVLSFFQVNLEPYKEALKDIKSKIEPSANVVDMYAGVGSIGLSVSDSPILVEVDENSVKMAEVNARSRGGKAKIVHAASEKALEHIGRAGNEILIFDPPRAGLHKKVTETVLATPPKKIIYLSCNPSTLARDLGLLQESYKISSFKGYNFFPRTPHIEALAILERA